VCDWYEAHGHRFGLRSTSAGFGEWLRYALGAYLVEPTADERTQSPTYSLVVEDDDAGEHRPVGRGYNILYVGTWDIARTLDVRFLARCLLRQIDSLGYRTRDDAVFLDAGVVEVAGSPTVVPSIIVPRLCRARRRAEKRGIYSPGGMVSAIDLDTGELVAPQLSLDVPHDAIDRLERSMPGSANGKHDRFPIEDGDRRSVSAVIGLGGVGQEDLVLARSRPETVLDLVMNVKNMPILAGLALRSIAAMVAMAPSRSISWSNDTELVEAVARAGSREWSGTMDTPPAVSEIRPGVDEERRSHP
jgi:hypothetical protein